VPCAVAHRWFVISLLSAILYGGTIVNASEAVAPAPGAVKAPDQPPPPATPPSASQREPVKAAAHIALLLPAGSNAFARHAEAVKTGFLTAAKTQGSAPLPIRIYAVSDDDQQTVATYLQALASGARLVVGPLTRDGVTALVRSDAIAVPTLALNVPDGATPLPENLYTLSLQIEAEARQLARFAFKEGRLNAFTVTGETPLLRRMHQAFVEEFKRLGGKHVAEYAFTADPAGLGRLKQAAALGVADMVFLALDFQRARIVRPYLDPLALYATSQVLSGGSGPLAGFDLASVRLLDMPWLLQPDHPAVMVYPRQDYHDAVDLERLYALGIDAFRVAQELLAGRTDMTLDGVTGRITLGRDQHFVRELLSAQFSDGKLLVFSEVKP
jgi:outer membrane PBP1 activator LpoA protein